MPVVSIVISICRQLCGLTGNSAGWHDKQPAWLQRLHNGAVLPSTLTPEGRRWRLCYGMKGDNLNNKICV